jgi:hypothetical protein
MSVVRKLRVDICENIYIMVVTPLYHIINGGNTILVFDDDFQLLHR